MSQFWYGFSWTIVYPSNCRSYAVSVVFPHKKKSLLNEQSIALLRSFLLRRTEIWKVFHSYSLSMWNSMRKPNKSSQWKWKALQYIVYTRKALYEDRIALLLKASSIKAATTLFQVGWVKVCKEFEALPNRCY